MTVPAVPADGADKARLLDVAYHHEPYWHPGQSDWIKSLLLFFDGVAVLVPDYMRDRPLFTDPTLAQPLADQGLLHRLSPETLVDQRPPKRLPSSWTTCCARTRSTATTETPPSPRSPTRVSAAPQTPA
jgi:hypothetical protein